jgi:hypothetical protein
MDLEEKEHKGKNWFHALMTWPSKHNVILCDNTDHFKNTTDKSLHPQSTLVILHIRKKSGDHETDNTLQNTKHNKYYRYNEKCLYSLLLT